MTLAMILAVLPVLLLMVYIYSEDSYEKEPLSLLVKIFFFGVLSAIPAIIFELLFGAIQDSAMTPNTTFYHFIKAFFVVAIVEEGVKFLAAHLASWKHQAFNYKFDGIVYCFFASMGFALLENILYVFSNSEIAIATAFVRALTTIPGHAMFAIFMGYYYGEAKYAREAGNKSGVKKNIIRGFITSVCLHGFYDFCLFTNDKTYLTIFYIFIIIADIYTIIVVHKASKNNKAVYYTPEYQQLWPGYYGNPQMMMQGMPGMPQGGPGIPQGGPGIPQGAPNIPQGNPYQPQGGPYIPQSNPYMPKGAPGMQQNTYNYQQTVPQTPNTYQQNAFTQQQNAFTQQQNGFTQQQNTYNQQVAETHTQILQRNTNQIVCPVCNSICNFNAFNCPVCNTPLRRYQGGSENNYVPYSYTQNQN